MKLHIYIAILFFFISSVSFCQFNSSTTFSGALSGCTTKYILDSKGIYFTAANCNQTTTVSFGSYVTSGNKITFKPQSFDSLPPIAEITESLASNDTLREITFLARYKQIIPDKSFAVDAIDSTGKSFKRFFLNDEGAVFINAHRYKTLRINYLDHFYARWIYIPLKAADLTIELSLPKEFFKHHHPLIDTNAGYSLFLKANSLYNSSGTQVAIRDNDKNYNLADY